MTNNAGFWKSKKFDIIFFIVVSVMNFGVGTWFYTKYQSIDNAREKVEALHKEYVQIKSVRIIINKIVDTEQQFIKRLYAGKKISAQEFINSYEKLNEIKMQIHFLLSKQER